MSSIMSPGKTTLLLSQSYRPPPLYRQWILVSSGRLSLRMCGLRICRKLSMNALPLSGGDSPSVIAGEDLVEKDWSFLDEPNHTNDYDMNMDRIVSAGAIAEDKRVLISMGSEGFVDHIMATATFSHLLVVHDSLYVLACIKEKHDKVKCWQGKLIEVPGIWAPFDSVFLYFLPALPFELDKVLSTVANLCSAGAKVVISHPGGRATLKEQREQHKDMITWDLPDETTLKNAAAVHKFDMIEFVDDHSFYNAILQFSG